MTVLLALKTPDAIFAACDCRRHNVGSKTVIDPVEKLRTVGDHSIWMIGGVMNAIPELEPELRAAKDVEELNELMTVNGQEAFDRWSVIAKRDGVENPGIYSIVAGFDRNGSARLFSHLFRTGEFKEHTETQAYVALATDDAAAKDIAEKAIPKNVSGSSIQCNTWARDIISTAAVQFPLQIGFPAQMWMRQKNMLPSYQKALSALAITEAPEWRVLLR